MSVVSAIRQMMAAGLSVEQALTAAEIMEAQASVAPDSALDRRRAVDAERQRRHRAKRDNNVMSRDQRDNVTERDPSPEKVSPTPPSKTNPIHIPPSPPKGGSVPQIVVVGEIVTDFDDFWRAYPHKIGKPKALLAYRQAIKRGGDPPSILAGLERAKARWNDPKFIPHPTTWLNRDGWNDEPANPVHPGTGQGRPIEPYLLAAQAVAQRSRTGFG
jgi:hypothetical protein